MKTPWTIVVVVTLAAALAALVLAPRLRTQRIDAAGNAAPDIRWAVDPARTDAYIAGLDLEAMARRGSDFTNPRFDPTRIGKALDEIDEHCDYDFDALEAAEARLIGVDRRRALAAIFERATAGAATHTEKHLKLLKWLHRVSYHCYKLRPMYRDCRRCWDPLVVLELNEMHCTHTARVVVDLWDAAGYPARVVGFGIKTSAEVYYDGDWHYFGADSIAGNGLTLMDDDGTIPSWREISLAPHRIDTLPYRYELTNRGRPRVRGTPVRSMHCFFTTGGDVSKYLTKARPALPGEFNYGWDNKVHRDPDWEMHEGDYRYQPGVVRFESVSVTPGSDPARAAVTLTWRPAIDRDHDLVGYRVFASTTPRGWNYAEFVGAPAARAFWSSDAGWNPDMYDALYSMPPRDVAAVEVTEPRVTLDVPATGACYVTVMAIDAYGERIGRTMYLQSNELAVKPAAALAAVHAAGHVAGHVPGPAPGAGSPRP